MLPPVRFAVAVVLCIALAVALVVVKRWLTELVQLWVDLADEVSSHDDRDPPSAGAGYRSPPPPFPA